MILSTYAQAGTSKRIQLWVGLFDVAPPPALAFRIDGAPATPMGTTGLTPIRDRVTNAKGAPLNHRGIFQFAVPRADHPYTVTIEAGSVKRDIVVTTLPESVPAFLDGTFNILLCSCYYQPEDASGLLGAIVSQIKMQPHLTVMAGDQVYCDLPLFENLPRSQPGLSQKLGEKYRRNWASSSLGVAGLEAVLARAPVVCIPDDHEFWNNYPFPQKQLENTWDQKNREQWAQAAQALYEDYQAAPGMAGAQRIDVDPLKMLFVDMRCHRDERFDRLMLPPALDALNRWSADLVASAQAHRPAVGVLCSGQALFIEPPEKESDQRNVDAEMGNYRQFDAVQKAIETVTDAGVPVLYLTGDVHWGRVSRGTDVVTGRTLIHEVIGSPSRLIRVPVLDSAKEALEGVKDVFGPNDPWPRHASPAKVPERFGSNRRFRLERLFKQRGDQVVMLSFARTGTGVEFQARYYPIHGNKKIAESVATDRIPLRIY